MKKSSNNFLSALLALAIIISLMGILTSLDKLGTSNMPSLTGAGTSGTGTTEITVEGTASLSITDDNITIPAGYYNASCTSGFARINSNATTELSCWLNTSGIEPWAASNMAPDYHTVVNDGSAAINLSLNTDQGDARSYLCGTNNCTDASGVNAFVTVTAYNSEALTCASGLITANTTLLNNESEFPNDLCSNMNFQTTKNELNVSYMYSIPSDVDQGSKEMTITYMATEI